MGTIRIASNKDSPSFNLVICTIREVHQIKTSANIDKGTKNFILPKNRPYPKSSSTEK